MTPKGFRRALRQESTPAERRMWVLLRDRRLGGAKFRRQHTVGPYTVDFYCHEAGLAIEVDGAVHDDPARAEADTVRQRDLLRLGVRTVRVSNDDVLHQPDLVLGRIAEALNSPHPVPLPRGEGTS